MKKQPWIKPVLSVLGVFSLFYVGTVLGADGGDPETLGDIASHVTKSFEDIGKLMIATAYLAGIGFTISAIFKFKQHKDNPTQIPIGTPVALLAVGAVLIFLPLLFKPAGKTIFGGASDSFTGSASGFEGGGISVLPGSNK